MSEFIDHLRVHGLRALANVNIGELGKVNLVTGKNSAGKTSLLEAIRLLVTGGSLSALSEILDYREELIARDARTLEASAGEIGHWQGLFTGFPAEGLRQHEYGRHEVEIVAQGTLPQNVRQLRISPAWIVRRIDPESGAVSVDTRKGGLFDEPEAEPAISISTGDGTRTIPIERLSRTRPTMLDKVSNGTPACVYLGPYNSDATDTLGALWDAIALTDLESEVVKALQLVSEDIDAVSMISATRGAGRRIAIARQRNQQYPVPLKTLGDGVNRLFGIVLSLTNARNGVLLIDEFENGLHYSIQRKLWRTIFELAVRFNVQVFATTHSWDSVESFQAAAATSDSNGVLLRLDKVAKNVHVTRFSEDELRIVARDNIEVR